MAATKKVHKVATNADLGLILKSIADLGKAGECNTAHVLVAADAARDMGDEWAQAASFLALLGRFMQTWPSPVMEWDGTEVPPQCHPSVTFGPVWWKMHLIYPSWPGTGLDRSVPCYAVRNRQVRGRRPGYELRPLTSSGRMSRDQGLDLEMVTATREEHNAKLREWRGNVPEKLGGTEGCSSPADPIRIPTCRESELPVA
jgi:hypothetical protein